MNTAKRDKIILSVLAIVIIGVIMFYLAIKPSMDEIDNLNSKIASAQSSIEGLKSKSQYISSLKIQLEEIEDEVKEAEGDISAFDDYAKYLADFQDITEDRATGTKITFSSTAPSKSGYYTLVQAKVDFMCAYDDLKFIMDDLLAKNVHCYDVDINVSIRSTEGDTQLRVTFTADYISKNGVYTPTDYDFSSGRYGLSQLFDGVAMVTTSTVNP